MKHILQNVSQRIDIVDIFCYYTGKVKRLSESGGKQLKNIMRGDIGSEGLELGQNWRDVDTIQDNTLPVSTLGLLDMSD